MLKKLLPFQYQTSVTSHPADVTTGGHAHLRDDVLLQFVLEERRRGQVGRQIQERYLFSPLLVPGDVTHGQSVTSYEGIQ